MNVRHCDVRPGASLVDVNSGPIVVRGSPRYVEGGWVVDVEGKLWNGHPIQFCACLANLRLP